MNKIVFLAMLGITAGALGDTPSQIFQTNARSVVYIQIEDAQHQVIDRGSGFVVSQDGYVVTAEHLRADASQTAWAVLGQRDGTRFPLTFRDSDPATDTALWQLPQSTACRTAVVLSAAPVKVLDRAIALGFPGLDGLTPSTFSITNLSSALGFYKVDGLLRPGNSGGPVFNESGQVIGFVEGGALPSSGNNDLVPIAPAISLIQKRGVRAGIGAPIPFDAACYASCRAPSHGVESWTSQIPWGPLDSGWVGGGHNRISECNALMASTLVNASPGSMIDLLPGDAGMWEESRKDLFTGRVDYKYSCRGTLKSEPVYVNKQSSACGLWN